MADGVHISTGNLLQASELAPNLVLKRAPNGILYASFGDTKLSDDAKRVLEQNHPDHPWLANNNKWPPKPGVLHQLNPFAGGQ